MLKQTCTVSGTRATARRYDTYIWGDGSGIHLRIPCALCRHLLPNQFLLFQEYPPPISSCWSFHPHSPWDGRRNRLGDPCAKRGALRQDVLGRFQSFLITKNRRFSASISDISLQEGSRRPCRMDIYDERKHFKACGVGGVALMAALQRLVSTTRAEKNARRRDDPKRHGRPSL